MSSRRSRHVEIGKAIADFLNSDAFQKRTLHDFSSLIRTRSDMEKVKADALRMARSFEHGLYGMRRDKMKFVDAPPYDAATKTGMYDHDDSG